MTFASGASRSSAAAPAFGHSFTLMMQPDLPLPLSRAAPGIYNIVDDDPAPVSQWLPALAEALGAKPPRRIPAWIARFIIGDAVMFMTSARGASNAKAKGAFGLNLLWTSWRDGFRRGLGDPSRT
jgi:2-alkyl-3-oxoalkanoate reductase